MKPKTMILMVVAVACGLGASYMTSKLLADRQPAPPEELVPVLMAKVKVPGWTPIKEPEKFFEIKMLPESAVSKSSLKSFDDVKDQRLNKPLDADRAALQGDLLTKEQQSLADGLAPGIRGIAVKVTPESLSGGFVLQGGRVDVVCTTRNSDPTAQVILQNMLVLALDTQADRNTEVKSILAQTVTLAATPEEALRLSLASTVGELRLLPRGQGDTKRTGNIVARLSDLNKPLSRTDGTSEVETPAPVVASTLPEIKEPVKEETPAPVVVVKPKKVHTMTLITGSTREKAVFFDGDVDDEDGNTSSTPAKKEPKPESKPEVKKEEPKTQPAAPAATATTKTSRTRRN